MRTIAELHEAALAATGAIIARIGPGQWADLTGCPEWDVRALVNHLVAGNLWASELAAGRTIDEVGSRLDGDLAGADPAAAYAASATAAAGAFAAPGALDAPCAVSYGPVPGSVYAAHRFVDVLIHGWDLAVATGQDAAIDGALVGACLKIVEPEAEQLRASGMFGRAVAVPDHADPQTRLLAMLGRSL
jgi:uncharacterized protein (TIGR03086 family)